MPRQRLINSPEEFLERVDGYFAACQEKPDKKPTYTGMLLALGFHSRQNMYDYGQREEFSEVVAWARLCMEEVYEGNLQGPNATGSIFALKNFGWQDKQELEHSGPGGGPMMITDQPMSDDEWEQQYGPSDLETTARPPEGAD